MNKLEDLLQARPQNDIWWGKQVHRRARPAVATGNPRLDGLLAGGGWPVGALSELLTTATGSGAMSLLAPALATLSRQQRRWIALIAPPFQPCAAAFVELDIDLKRLLIVHPRDREQHAWALEQALRAGACGAVLAWPDDKLDNTRLRRLQLAAREGKSCGFLIRPRSCMTQSSPAAVRIALRASPRGVHIEVIKRQGGWPVEGFESVLPKTRTPTH